MSPTHHSAHFRKQKKCIYNFTLTIYLTEKESKYYYTSVSQLQISNITPLKKKKEQNHRNQWAISYPTTGRQLAKRNRRMNMIILSLGKQSICKIDLLLNVVQSINRNCACHLVFHSLSTLIFENMILTNELC